jgi:hypothetical protein
MKMNLKLVSSKDAMDRADGFGFEFRSTHYPSLITHHHNDIRE